MSRLKRYSHALVSSYALTGVNVLYTLLSVPLALKYLSKAEFGLWALTFQIANYVMLIDLGMSSSVSRILIDHKDDRTNGLYGGVIKSAAWVGIAQSAISLVLGLSIVWFLGGWLRVPQDLGHAFLWLMIGQVLITAATFCTRIFGQILCAWQRMDVFNYAGMVQLLSSLAGLWVSFVLGFGIYSLLAGAAVGWFCGVALNAWACERLGLLPKAGEWGRATRKQFAELFSYGADLFLINLANQLILSSQTILVSRQLGIELAAVWAVMTKVFTMVCQIVWRIIGLAMPAFAEMTVRKEAERMWNRYHALFVTVSVFSAVGGILFAACNGPFVAVWMQGKFSWAPVNNVLLAVWLILQSQQSCLNSLILNLKETKVVRFAYPAEGIAFVALAIIMLNRWGITGMLVCSVAATLLFTWSNGIWLVGRLMGRRWKALLWDWQLPMIWVLMWMIPAWLGLEWAFHNTSELFRFAVNGTALGLLGAWAALRFGLPGSLTAELVGKLPPPLRRPVLALIRPT